MYKQWGNQNEPDQVIWLFLYIASRHMSTYATTKRSFDDSNKFYGWEIRKKIDGVYDSCKYLKRKRKKVNIVDNRRMINKNKILS